MVKVGLDDMIAFVMRVEWVDERELIESFCVLVHRGGGGPRVLRTT